MCNGRRDDMFQSLIGRLKTGVIVKGQKPTLLFQSLIGRLKTSSHLKSRYVLTGFNPL